MGREISRNGLNLSTLCIITVHSNGTVSPGNYMYNKKVKKTDRETEDREALKSIETIDGIHSPDSRGQGEPEKK